MLGCFNRVQFFATLWIVAHQAPQFMGFSRQEYGVCCHALLQGNLPNPGIEPMSPTSPTLAAGFFITSTNWEAS